MLCGGSRGERARDAGICPIYGGMCSVSHTSSIAQTHIKGRGHMPGICSVSHTSYIAQTHVPRCRALLDGTACKAHTTPPAPPALPRPVSAACACIIRIYRYIYTYIFAHYIYTYIRTGSAVVPVSTRRVYYTARAHAHSEVTGMRIRCRHSPLRALSGVHWPSLSSRAACNLPRVRVSGRTGRVFRLHAPVVCEDICDDMYNAMMYTR
jgi:hypothetical protein